MGDWLETPIGFVNFDQIQTFGIYPELPEPETLSAWTSKPKSAPKQAMGQVYSVRAQFADGQIRDIFWNLNWEQAWAMRKGFRDVMSKQGQGGGGWAVGVMVPF